MAVAAAYDCMKGKDRKALDGLYFASTTMPFADRINAGIVAAALNMREQGTVNADFSACMKSGTTACISAIEAIMAGTRDSILVSAADQRRTKMATMLEMFYGDGAAALLFGKSDVIAEFKGSYSINCDFVDHYRGTGKEFDYAYEERWVRDIGYGRIIPEAIRGFLAKYGMKATDFSRVIYPCYFSGTHAAIARELGIDKQRVQDNLHAACGDTGSAHPLLLLVAALEKASPGKSFWSPVSDRDATSWRSRSPRISRSWSRAWEWLGRLPTKWILRISRNMPNSGISSPPTLEYAARRIPLRRLPSCGGNAKCCLDLWA
jgi:3-hydroxy-3-methylglutaryl CoA synthase